MNLTQISEHDYIFNTDTRWLSATVLLHITAQDGVVLIDSGCAACPELFEELDRRHLHAAGVICTHLHWDHICNNLEVCRRGGKIYAAQKGRDSISIPRLFNFPTCFTENGSLEIEGSEFRIIPAPGHTVGHAVIATPEGNCHIGDAMIAEKEMKYSKLPYMEDVPAAIESMKMICGLGYANYIAGHTGLIPGAEISRIADLNIRKELQLNDDICRFLEEPVQEEAAPAAFMRYAGINNPVVLNSRGWQYAVVIRLQELEEAGRITRDGDMLYAVRPQKS